jgi:hypothetical protein
MQDTICKRLLTGLRGFCVMLLTVSGNAMRAIIVHALLTDGAPF